MGIDSVTIIIASMWRDSNRWNISIVILGLAYCGFYYLVSLTEPITDLEDSNLRAKVESDICNLLNLEK